MRRNLLLRHDRGFVLPVTVMLLALISAGVVLMAHRTDQLRQLVTASNEEQAAEAAVQAALAQAQYLAATMFRRGSRLGDIELDGRYYRGAGGAYVSYQDAGGLFNLKGASEIELTRLLTALGIKDDKAAVLTDTLLDYTDADNLVRVNGAEEADYAAAKMPPPRNAPLLMANELQRIYGWRDLEPAMMRSVLDNVYVGPTSVVNRYTVRMPALAAITGADEPAIRDLLQQRAADQPANIESLPSVARGSFLLASRFVTLPSATTIVTVCPPKVAWCQRIGLTATPDSSPAPWHIDFSIRQMRSAPLPPAAQLQPLPDQPPKEPPPALWTIFGPTP